MQTFFADTVYYIAVLNPGDQSSFAVDALAAEIAQAQIVTSDPVLVELLAWAGTRGAFHRRAAIALVDALRANPNVTIVRQTPALFDAGFELYRKRPDKGYSLTDCMSMTICHQRKIAQVLTHDRHFAQEGFEVLL